MFCFGFLWLEIPNFFLSVYCPRRRTFAASGVNFTIVVVIDNRLDPIVIAHSSVSLFPFAPSHSPVSSASIISPSLSLPPFSFPPFLSLFPSSFPPSFSLYAKGDEFRSDRCTEVTRSAAYICEFIVTQFATRHTTHRPVREGACLRRRVLSRG